MTPDSTAPGLLRAVGLLADGPVPWGRPVPARGPGIYVVELPAPLPTAPIELTRVGKWIEHVETLRLDGERPTSRALASRIGSFWLPSQTVLYVGATSASIGARVRAQRETVLGDRRPNSGGHWLHLLTGLERARLWWAATDAVEEYEDAVLAAFAEGVPAADRAALPDDGVVLPFANLRTPTGDRKRTGLSGSILAEPVVVAPPTTIVQLPDGDADGARGEPPVPRSRARSAGGGAAAGGGGAAAAARGAARGAARPAGSAAAGGTTSRPAGPSAASGGTVRRTRAPGPGHAARPADPVHLTADGAERLREELRTLTEDRRPEVVARIRAAKELGDLKENADYTSAREEQSFLEGRIQALEAQLRAAQIIEAPVTGSAIGLGSTVTVESAGEEFTYVLVGTTEADPANGRLSVASPVGQALLGRRPGDDVLVRTPRGEAQYRVLTAS